MPFTLTDEAYSTLKAYLDQLRRYYVSQRGGNEIVDDIEERVGELLNERTQMGERVVSENDVKEVIAIMGTPEMIEQDSDSKTSYSGPKTSSTQIPSKKLYRDVDHRVLGGVCSGLAAYWNKDTSWVRVITVLLFVLSTLFLHWSHGESFFWFNGGLVMVYLVLWIAVPAARTVEERCAMRGEPVSAQEFEYHASRSNSGGNYSERHNTSRTGNGFWRTVGRVLVILIGLFFLLISSSILIAMVAALCGVGIAMGSILPSSLLGIVAFTGNVWLLKVLVCLVFLLPVVGLIYLGCRMVFKLRGLRWVGLVMFIVWLASVIGILVVGSQGLKEYSRKGKFDERVALTLPSDTLYIDLVANTPMPDDYYLTANSSLLELGWITGKKKDIAVTAFPVLQIIRQSADSEPELRIESHAFAKSHNAAQLKAERMKPSYTLTDNVLSIDALSVNKRDKWSGNYGELSLYVPSNQVVIVRKPFTHEFGKSTSKSVCEIGSAFAPWRLHRDQDDWDVDIDLDW